VLGRILDPLGRPLDDLGPISPRVTKKKIVREVPNPSKRTRIRETIPDGVRVMDAFTTCGRGQRSVSSPAAAWAKAACSA